MTLLILSCGWTAQAVVPSTEVPADFQNQAGQAAADSKDANAQQAAPPAAAPGAQQAPAPEKKKESGEEKAQAHEGGVSKDRLFWTLPNFLSIQSAGQLPPLTVGQKFKVVARGTFDPTEWAYLGVVTFIDQANNTEPAYGQGAEGYGKRYATNFADTTVENFMVGAVFPSILRQDPRYYQMGKGSFLHRTKYALSRLFITHSDSGHTQFNYSEVFGAAFAAGISTYAYHPREDKNWGNAGSVWGTQIALDAVGFMLKEFWPDIRHKFEKHKHETQ